MALWGVGRVIAGRYLLLHRLGSGGLWQVWLAHDRRLACEVALRQVASLAEAGQAAGLRDHPHVLTVHDVLEHEGRPWIVTEYVTGAVDLRDLVARRGPLAPAECARIGLAVLDALTAGHERGVLHRDVNPASILLAPDRTGSPYGRVLLTGHGAAGQPDADATPAADLFSLGRTLYYGVEGREPFERASRQGEEARPPVRAGALEPVLRGLLAKDPAERITAAQAAAELAVIVTPQTEAYARAETDQESQPPWVAAPHGFGPVVAPDRHRRPRLRALRAALACGLGLVLAVGGAWYALADRAGDGTGTPYGDTVGLAVPLKDGDCVVADWPGGARFTGTPRLTLDPTCREKAPDGQVMGFVAASSAGEARERGPARCEERTREVRDRLADVRSYAVVPTGAGFEAAGRRTACLLLGAHGPVHGPLDRHRRPGTAFSDTSTMQRRDCLDVRSRREARLVPCEGPYDEQVLGFTRLGRGVTLGEARTASDAACARAVPPHDYGFDPSVYEAGSWTGHGPWKSGTHVVVCTVRRQNGGTMEKDEP
jgi:hypothetical protein